MLHQTAVSSDLYIDANIIIAICCEQPMIKPLRLFSSSAHLNSKNNYIYKKGINMKENISLM